MADEAMQEALAKQRAACPFCRIVAGEIPSSKVYEDEGFLAILDIRPAAPGHVLLVPKEHAPILQLLPEARLRAAFPLAARLAGAVREAMIVPEVDLVVVNGLAPGNQAMHALIHLIPRENGDRLERFDIRTLTTEQADTLALAPQLETTVRDVLVRLGKSGAPRVAPVPADASAPVVRVASRPPEPARSPAIEPPQEEAVEFDDPRDALLRVLETNPDLRKMLIAQPSLVEQYVSQSPRLAKLFAGVDIAALSAALRAQDNRAQAGQPLPRLAKDMSDPELFAFIDGNEGLRRWMLEAPDEFASGVSENPRLSAFFRGIDVRALANRFAAFKNGGVA